uniref:TROVE domain-containing protein n=1 Tax=Leishmania guyanensis TaxID=5670 RepID=A0A1E1IYK9_LEIGU|nr:hypothetical protein, conserved [Leishmania guyanensis]
MEYFCSTNAAELTPLKTELVDLVSSCLMKEPPFEETVPGQPPQTAAPTARSTTVGDAAVGVALAPPPRRSNDSASTVAQMRELVHLISRQDGEFVLKLALYARHELHLRRSPSFLAALCTREPNCIPFLKPYMERIIVLPSDWLAVANFAYFYDCDAAHNYAGTLMYPAKTKRDAHTNKSAAPNTHKRSSTAIAADRLQCCSPNRSPSSTDKCSPAPSAVEACSGSESLPGTNPLASRTRTKAKGGHHQGAAPRNPTHSYIPAALRSALVGTFTKFSIFSIAKYDNEAAEHRAKRRQVRRAQAAAAASNTSDSDGSSAADNRLAAPSRRARPRTFTFKQLIRILHITEPAYIVCCLLGKRYPTNEDDFRRMKLHLTDPTWKPPSLKTRVASSAKGGHSSKDTDGRAVISNSGDVQEEDESHQEKAELPFCVFDARRAGQRMRLPVPETWETQLSKEGNTGRVWDELISSNAVPYMALLRNLRNILTRLCSAKTHKRVLERLVDEQQVAASQQLPYRFYSAYLAVQQIGKSLAFLDALRTMPRGERPTKENAVFARSRGGRGRSRVTVESESAAGVVSKAVVEAAKSFERPMVPRPYLRRYMAQYCAALDSAINTSARLNVIPAKGTSIVIICVTSALFEPMSAMGAAAATPTSIQRKVDVTALLVAMLMRSCEQCVVLIYCYDEYVVFRENDLDEKTMSKGTYDDDGDSHSSWGSESSSSNTDEATAGEDDLHAMSNPLQRPSATASQEAAPGLMRLVDTLTARCSSLLERKREEVGADCIATSFAMFAAAAGAQFPYAFFDEVIECNMRVESLLVFDEGVHRTYANMNRNAPAFGDLPTYLSRLRRTSSPDLVYVGVNLKASNPPTAKRVSQMLGAAVAPVTASAASSPVPGSGAAVALEKEAVKLRFSHHNDVLLTGFSDSILRLVAVRTGGGSLTTIERAAETYHVSLLSSRASQATWAERSKVLKVLAALRGGQKSHIGGGDGSPETSPALGSLSFKSCVDPLTQSGTTTATHRQGFSFPSSKTSLVSQTMTVPAVVLPSFDADGKAISATGWDWNRSSLGSDRRLQWLASSTAGLSTMSSASAASSAYDAEAPAKSPIALPSIRRLLAKPSFAESEVTVAMASVSGTDSSPGAAVGAVRHRNASDARESEPAWLGAEGKNVLPVFHPQPGISIVKLLSRSSSSRGDGAAKTAGVDAASDSGSARTDRCNQKRAGDARLHAQASQRQQTESTVSATAGVADAAATTTVTQVKASERSATRRRRLDQASRPPLPAASEVVRRLLTSYRVCRFFISSTFLDMNNERNALTLDIFPRLRRWAAEAGLKVTLLEVDLRWGIPALATSRNLSTSVCLNEVSRCSPFFFGMIGARYGSCPPTPLQLVIDEDVDTEDYAWMQELSDPHVSVTELEMRHAVYNAKRRLGNDEAPSSALFFARDSPHLLSTFGPTESACRAVYDADSPSAAEAIARLKQRITESGCKLVSYQAEYIGSAKALLPGAIGCSSGGAPLLAGGANRSTTMRSGAREMMEDDLGRWVVQSRHGFGGNAGQAALSTSGSSGVGSGDASKAGSLWSFVKARITESEESKRLTSMDAPIDMTDFSNKAFHALQEVICRVCGVCPAPDEDAAENQQQHADGRAADAHEPEKNAGTHERARIAIPLTAATSEAIATEVPDMYEILIVAQSEFARKLSNLYAAPGGLLEQLSNFVLNGTLGVADDSDTPSEARAERQKGVAAHDTKHHDYVTLSPFSEGAYDSRPVRGSSSLPPPPQPLVMHAAARGGGTSSILLLEGCDGDGKSSALAALTVLVLEPMHKSSVPETTLRFLFYSTQAEDDSVRGLLFFLAKSLRVFFQLYGEVSVRDTDSVDELLLVLDQVYAAIHHRFETSRNGAGRAIAAQGERSSNGDRSATGRATAGASQVALVVILDGLDKSSEAAELVSLLGTILHPLATQHIRFVVSACPQSSVARALRMRTPPIRVLAVPTLSEGERAELVRLHLANYGKFLEESFTADELKNLLRKSDAGRPSYLISAITHLRLFSTFDTLREDIRSLPASRATLHKQLFHHLQSRFDPTTCRVVLSILLLRQPAGGVLEFNLYRLVSDVATASRLVTLLRGICLDPHHVRLFIKSSTFVDAIARTFFRFASDYQSTQERVLLAELRYQPIDVSLEEQEVKIGLRQVTESIHRSSADPLTPRTFVPERYAPRELLGMLQGSVQACRLDVTTALVCHLPFLECLLVNHRMLSQLLGLLSSVVSATTSASSLVLDTSAVTGVTQSEDEEGTEDSCNARPLASYSALALRWRQYRSEVRRLGGVLDILQRNYHVLLRQPALLRQCVWNTVGPAMCISTYDATSTACLQAALQAMTASSDTTSNNVHARLQGELQRPQGTSAPISAAPSLNMPISMLSTMWVHWLNARQHSGEDRVMLTTASPKPIRCMAMSPDGMEVALGDDEGVLRRVSANEDEQQQLHRSQLALTETDSVGGAGGVRRRRVASALRHESAVTAVLYVAPCSAGGSIAGTKCTGVPANLSASTGTAQLLVSGCARGLLYVWSLEDNSLLQRGTGHLRAVSGLVCHPLEPAVLCSCSHDSFVMLWGVGSAGAASRLCSEIQAALVLRMPKHPAGSAERIQQERLQQRARGNVNDQPRVRGGGTASAAVRHRTHALTDGTGGKQTPFQASLTPFHTERQHHTPVEAVAFHRSGDIFASGSWDGVLVLHNTRELCTPSPLITPEMKVSFDSPKPTRVTSRRSRHAELVWRTRHGPERRQVTFHSTRLALDSSVRALSFSNSLAVTCVVGCHNGTVVVVDHASAAVVARWASLHAAPVTRLTASLDGRCVASADEHGVVRLTYIGITGSVFATFSGHHGAVTGLCFRPPRTGQDEDVAGGTDPLQAPPAVLLTAGEDSTLQAWRVDSSGSRGFGTKTAMSRRHLITAHCTAITAVASSCNGQLIVTGSADGTAVVFRVPEEDDDDDVTCGGPGGAAASRDCASCTATLDPSKASGKRMSQASATVAGNAQTTRPLKPAFTLKHDHGRVTCIRLALHDTRIVVGVVFGLVYVWSSSPGLNLVEGRLLLRIRVPEHGLYPVISLGVMERSCAVAVVGDRGQGVAGTDRTAQQARGAETALTLANLLQTACRRTRASATAATVLMTPPTEKEDESSALVTAVCANGDVAVFKLLGDAVSLVMAAGKARRRQRQLCHQRRTSYSATSVPHGAFTRNGSFSCSSSAEALDCVTMEVGTVAASPASKSLSWVESGRAHGEVTPHAGSTATTANSTPHTEEANPAPTQVGWRQLRTPTTDCVAYDRSGAPLAASASLIPQEVPLIKASRRPRQMLDRRAQKLQHLLSRCRATEVELCKSYHLHLHRHRLRWAHAADAEEITSVVWLSSQSLKLPPSDNVVDEVEGKQYRLALVVAQRQLFLLFGNGRESALSRCLTVRVPSHPSDGVPPLTSSTGIMPEDGTAVGAQEWGTSGYATCAQNDAVPLEAAETTAAEEFEVDLSHILCEDEYFTSASSAVEVAGVAPSTVTAEVIRWFAVAVTTSHGEVLLLRLQVPHVHGKHTDPLGVSTTPLTGAGARPPTTVMQHLCTYILPNTSITLCRRLSFTCSVADQAEEGDDVEASTSGAVLHRMTASPHATSIELCALPPALGASLDASATSLPWGAAATVVERVALLAGCTDGSTRVWLAAVPPPSPHSCCVCSVDVKMAEAPKQPHITRANWTPIGCFFCTSSVCVVSGLLNGSGQRASGNGVSAPVPSLRWIVGDTLGNVYQLQLERDAPGGVAALLGNSHGMLKVAASGTRNGNSGDSEVSLTQFNADDVSAKPWVRSLQKSSAMMSHTSPASVVQAMLTSSASICADESFLAGVGMATDEAVGTLAWPGWASHSPEDWIAPVDISSSLPTLLRRAASSTGVRANAASEWQNTDGKLRAATRSPSAGAADGTLRIGDESPQLSTAAPLHSTRANLPPVQCFCLPDLPQVQRVSTTVFPNTTNSTAECATERGSDGPAHLTLLNGISLSSPPAALPSFATGPRPNNGVLEHQGASNDGRALSVEQTFSMPLTSLLTDYRRQGAGADSGTSEASSCKAAAVKLSRRGETNATVHFEVSTAPPVVSPAPSLNQSLPQDDRQQHCSNDDDEEDYFAVLYETKPPMSQLPYADRPEAGRAWLLHQQEVLKEAMRVQQYNKLARRALEAYQLRMATAAGL